MKRKLGFLLSLFTLLFILPISVLAEGFTTTISGTDVASVNEKIDYTIAIKTEQQAVEFEAAIKYDTDILELVSILKEESWVGNNSVVNNGNNTIKFTNNGITGESSVVTLRFKVKSSIKNSTTLSLEDIKLTVASTNSSEEQTEDNIVLTFDNLKKDISIKSDDNTLKNIKVDNKAISGFNPDVLEYTLEVDSLLEKVKINATLNNADTATFVDGFGNREEDLKYGENVVLIKVKSESEKILTYTLKIIRKDDRIANTDLKSILLNSGKIKINFDKNVLTYNIKTYKLETIDVSVETDDSTSIAKIDAPSKLIIGDNKIKITVTAVTGDTKEYNILIVNSEVPIDTRLKNLSVKGQNIGFNSDNYKYFIRYDKSYKDGLKIYKTTISNDVEVEVIGNTNLKEGSVVKIIVTSLDGSNSSEYTITLEKDTRINFFLILDILIGIVLVILIVIQVKRRKKIKNEKEAKKKELELSKTKEIKL